MALTNEERIAARTVRDHATGCRIWTGTIPDGVPSLRVNGNTISVRRYLWRAAYPDKTPPHNLGPCAVSGARCVEPSHAALRRKASHIPPVYVAPAIRGGSLEPCPVCGLAMTGSRAGNVYCIPCWRREHPVPDAAAIVATVEPVVPVTPSRFPTLGPRLAERWARQATAAD